MERSLRCVSKSIDITSHFLALRVQKRKQCVSKARRQALGLAVVRSFLGIGFIFSLYRSVIMRPSLPPGIKLFPRPNRHEHRVDHTGSLPFSSERLNFKVVDFMNDLLG